MYLRSLRICESLPVIKEIRNVTFKKGLNIIIDESTTFSDKGNNVGKTTFLKLIDICLGAQDKKYIWTDNDTSSETTALKNYIHNNKVFVELKIINKSDIIYTFKVELFERGKRYINEKSYPYNQYTDKLNEILFKTSKPPSLRQLIGKFVRINQKTDTNTLLKYLHQNTTDVAYQNIYDFLFKLSTQEISTKKLRLQNEIRGIQEDLKEIIRLHKFTNIADLSERTRIVNNTVIQLQNSIEPMINTSEFRLQTEKSSIIQNEINSLNDAINAANFQKTKIENILIKENRESDYIEDEILREFYNEIQNELGNVSKKFDELVDFNNQIKQNKINYYNKRLIKLNENITMMIFARDSIIENNKDIISLINEDNYPEFEKLHGELLSQTELLGELKKVKSIYEGLTTSLVDKKDELTEIDSSESPSDNLSKFNEYLLDYTNTIFGQRLYLTRSSPFPIKLSNVDDGIGTGHRKTITLLLDIAYVSFINELDLDYPKFFVHDVIETIDKHNFLNIVNFINQNESQFIFAILNEKISPYTFIQEEDKRLKLSTENKLFKL